MEKEQYLEFVKYLEKLSRKGILVKKVVDYGRGRYFLIKNSPLYICTCAEWCWSPKSQIIFILKSRSPAERILIPKRVLSFRTFFELLPSKEKKHFAYHLDLFQKRA